MKRAYTSIYADTSSQSRDLSERHPERGFEKTSHGSRCDVGAPTQELKKDHKESKERKTPKPRKSRAKGPRLPGQRYSFKSPGRVHALNTDLVFIESRENKQAERSKKSRERYENQQYQKRLQALATGGAWSPPTEHYPLGRVYSAETMRMWETAGGRLGAANLAAKNERKLPATDGLHGLNGEVHPKRKNQGGLVLRSTGEELAFNFDFDHLKAFKDRDPKFEELSYPEIQNSEACNDISCNIHGRITFFTRDIDHRLDNENWQTQVKGTDFLFTMLEESLRDVSIYSPVSYQFAQRQFKLLHKTLTDFALRQLTNFFSGRLVHPDVESIRQFLFRSFRSADYWDKIGLEAYDEEALLRLYKRESKRFLNHWNSFLHAIFPGSARVIDRSADLFMDFCESESGQEISWTSEMVAYKLIDCLESAKIDLDYGEDDLFKHWLNWRKKAKYRSRGKYSDRLNPESIPALPKRFKPTGTKGLYRSKELYRSCKKSSK
jgi:hypothetical protein